jgi:hypothetical protein
MGRIEVEKLGCLSVAVFCYFDVSIGVVGDGSKERRGRQGKATKMAGVAWELNNNIWVLTLSILRFGKPPPRRSHRDNNR